MQKNSLSRYERGGVPEIEWEQYRTCNVSTAGRGPGDLVKLVKHRFRRAQTLDRLYIMEEVCGEFGGQCGDLFDLCRKRVRRQYKFSFVPSHVLRCPARDLADWAWASLHTNARLIHEADRWFGGLWRLSLKDYQQAASFGGDNGVRLVFTDEKQ